MLRHFSYFSGSLVFAALAVFAGFLLGGWPAALTVAFLVVLETSLSFDNAVVNATILEHWDARWRRRFLTWGVVVAVFGMRFLFPLLIVGVAGQLDPLAALRLAMDAPAEYHRLLAGAQHQIAAFGGAFLLMVFCKFFIARHKTEHWLKAIEQPLTRLGKMEAIEAALTLLVVMLVSRLLVGPLRGEFVEAGVWGVITFVLTKGLAAWLGAGTQGDEAQAEVGAAIVRQGVAGFAYIELIDASFSFDGVVGAFALTNNLFIIALGLGAGAMFVRSFTVVLVERGTLSHYRYLEHGAFWAIGALAAIMLASACFRVPEVVAGLLGAALIALALASSVLANRRDARRALATDHSFPREMP